MGPKVVVWKGVQTAFLKVGPKDSNMAAAKDEKMAVAMGGLRVVGSAKA
jgi:hypothetical protein